VLDTYHWERHPIGKRVLRQSGLMMRGVTLHPRLARWTRDRLAPPVLGIGRVRDLVAGSFAGTELRYPHHRGQHELVGTRATEVPLVEGRLTAIQRNPGFVLIREPGAVAPPAAAAPGVQHAERTDLGPALLVRPDGYVAWAGSLDDDRNGGWAADWKRWTSQPATAGAHR